MILEIKNYKDERIGAIALTENNINGEIEVYNKDENTLVLDRSYQYDDIFGTNDRKISIHIEPKENRTINNMIDKIQTINVEEIGKKIAEECANFHENDLNIDDIYTDVTNYVHNSFKADTIYFAIIYFAFKYLDDNNIKYKK